MEQHFDISIHALRVEGDLGVGGTDELTFSDFYPRPPGGGRPRRTAAELHSPYFYPRPPGGGRLLLRYNNNLRIIISIHALRVEGDLV